MICTDINLGNIYGTSEDAVHDVLDQGIKILTNKYNDWKSISRGDTGAKRANFFMSQEDVNLADRKING